MESLGKFRKKEIQEFGYVSRHSTMGDNEMAERKLCKTIDILFALSITAVNAIG